MILPATTRVRYCNGQPRYLDGALATVIQKQPNEPRYLIQFDNNPAARRFAGGTWCVHEANLEPVERDWADEKGKTAAKRWFTTIAPKIEQEAIRWANENPDVDRETYFGLHHPQLLWRFYYHLSEQLAEAARGWETIYHNAKGQDSGTEEVERG